MTENEYREELFKGYIQGHVFDEMENVLENFHITMRNLRLPDMDLKNIILAYNNKVINISNDFKKADIKFFDHQQCETRFAIDNYLQTYILYGSQSLNYFFKIASTITDKQKEEFLASQIPPTKFEQIFKGKKFSPKVFVHSKDQLTNMYQALFLYHYSYCKVANFSISNDIVAAILVYKILCYGNGIDISDRVDTIDQELQKLGYESIKPYIEEQEKIQELSLKNVLYIESVKINEQTSNI